MWLWWLDDDGVVAPPPATRTVYLLLADSQGEPIEGVEGMLTTAHLPQQIDGVWMVRLAREATSDALGRIEWEDVQVGADVLLEIPSARIYRKVTVSAGAGDLQV